MAKQLTGQIVSLKMTNAVVVAVERTIRHPMYNKIMRRTKQYKARIDGSLKLAVGDTVVISETRPLSKDIHFKVASKVEKS